MKKIECYLLEPGFYPEGATVYVIGGEYVFFHGIANQFFVWFSTIKADRPLEKIVAELPGGELDGYGSGFAGTYAEAMDLLLTEINHGLSPEF